MNGDQLPDWRETPARQPMLELLWMLSGHGFSDGDLAMQWTAGSPHRTLPLVVQHTDAEHEYAYDRYPILGSGTGHATATERGWTVTDMAADWPAVYPPVL